MLIGNYLVRSYGTGDGTITIKVESINDTINDEISSEKLSSICTKYVKSRWPDEKDWFFVDSFNNSVRMAIRLILTEDSAVIIKDKKYDIYVKDNCRRRIIESDIIVTHNNCTVKFSEIINPVVFYLNNKELFN